MDIHGMGVRTCMWGAPVTASSLCDSNCCKTLFRPIWLVGMRRTTRFISGLARHARLLSIQRQCSADSIP